MTVIGAHVLLYTPEPEALRAVFRDVFGWKHVDAGGGWLIFALPPAELGVHPAEGPTWESNVRHQLSFICDDVAATVKELRARGVEIQGEPVDEGFGVTVMSVLPGGVQVMLYEPRHPLAIEVGKRAPSTKKTPAKKKAAARKKATAKMKPRAATKRSRTSRARTRTRR